MTRDEIAQIYSQIENLSANEIKELVDEEMEKSANELQYGIRKYALGISATSSLRNGARPNRDIKDICERFFYEHISTIKEIIHNNPKSSNYIIEIIMLLAPAIAQQYTGFSGMAIVGTITYFCKQNVQSFIG